MSIFSRLSDILNANITALLDKAEDPEKMARLMLQEMEETLVEVRSDAAGLIADKKDIERQLANRLSNIEEWTAKARLALEHNREDLARHALAEKQRLLSESREKEQYLAEMEQQLGRHDEDIQRLQNAMKEARKRLESLRLRRQVSQNRLKMRESTREKARLRQEARFEEMERDLDALDSQLEAQGLGTSELEQEFQNLEMNSAVEQELASLKASLSTENPEKAV
ncbi:PspA/IM30 family protein [Salinisphaera sp. G21_0]|uniref:PspA/IM30 family protein n=1 Tax=Salinisphaera sp. G21_0 TaxID=2821094 RepID=UPI001ADB1643|nr:PspA/IM30 family protein [Salinisphaera sp. G21_0]MBO9483006.1 PspA/IM30 family protein [Salinisphaera sp. G21_0]